VVSGPTICSLRPHTRGRKQLDCAGESCAVVSQVDRVFPAMAGSFRFSRDGFHSSAEFELSHR
jgi:hypothetical protein